MTPATLLIDFNGVALHAYHAAPQRKIDTETGEPYATPAAAISTFLSIYVDHWLEICAPSQWKVVSDNGTPIQMIWGREKGYKAQREDRKKSVDKSEAISKYLGTLKQLLQGLGAQHYHSPHTEADDTIAYIAQGLPGPKVIYSVDTDFMQMLVDPEVSVILKGTDLYQHGDCEYSGVPFHHWVLMRSLLGKNSDNYNGVHGFGVVKWKEIVGSWNKEEMDRLEEMIAEGRRGEILAWADEDPSKARALAPFNRSENTPIYLKNMHRLASLHPEICESVAVSSTIRKLIPSGRIRHSDFLSTTFASIGLSDLVSKYEHLGVSSTLVTSKNWDSLKERVQTLINAAPCVAFDYETWQEPNVELNAASKSRGDFVDMRSQVLSGFSICCGENLNYGFYFSIDHKATANLPQGIVEEVLGMVPETTPLVVQNAAFELTVTLNCLGLEIEDVHDTRIMATHVDENSPNDLKTMSRKVLGYDQIKYNDVVPQGMTMRDITGIDANQYGCEDSITTARLYMLYRTVLQAEGTWDFYLENEVLPQNVLARSYLQGIKLNLDRMLELRKEDAYLQENSMKMLRMLLSGHANQPKTRAATHLLAFDREYLAHKKGSAAVVSGEVHKEFEAASVYKPYKVSQQLMPSSKLTLTPSKLNKMIAAAGGVGLTPLTKSSKLVLSAWALKFKDTTIDPKLKKLANALLTLLNNAQCAYAKLHQTPEFAAFEGEMVDLGLWAHIYKEVKTGSELNLGSPKQMTELLYLMIGIYPRLRTMPQPGSVRDQMRLQGAPATDELAIKTALKLDDLQPWQQNALNLLLKAKQCRTRESLFYTPYEHYYKGHGDGRLHPRITQAGAPATRRQSGSSPNLQQASKGPGIRSAYEADEGHVVISMDWKGQELRLLAGLSRDPVLLDAYCGEVERDVHSVTASGMTKMTYNEFVKIHEDENHPRFKELDKVRTDGKPVTFGVIYLAKEFTLARNMIIPEEEAKSYIDDWHNTYPGVHPWQEDSIRLGRRLGYVPTLFGTRRHATSDITSKDKRIRGRMERQLVNSRIQGSAAAQMSRLMSDIYRSGLMDRLSVGFIVGVHDEILGVVPIKHAVQYVKELGALMRKPVPNCEPPFDTDLEIGLNWGHMHKCSQDAEAITALINSLKEEEEVA